MISGILTGRSITSVKEVLGAAKRLFRPWQVAGERSLIIFMYGLKGLIRDLIVGRPSLVFPIDEVEIVLCAMSSAILRRLADLK